MARDLKPIDITDNPELLRLAEEVARSQEPRVLVRAAEELVEVRPVPAKPKRSPRGRPVTEDDPLSRSIGSGRSGIPDGASGQRPRRTRGSANPNDWLLRLVDIGAAVAPADRPTDVSANKHKYVAAAYYTESHKSPRR